MDQSTAIEPGTVALDPPSTVLTPDTAKHVSGGGKTAISEATDDLGAVLESELARLRADDAKADKSDEAKDAAEPKEEAKAKGTKDDDKAAKPRAEDGKFAKAQDKAEAEPEPKAEKGEPAKVAQQEAPERRPSEGQHREPPARFLPEARAKWANVPNEVKAEFHRVSAEMEQESKQFRASHERYETLKPFDDLARSNGRDLRESLTKVNEIENALQRNPIAGLDAVLREVGPRKQDGSPLTIMDVAQYLTQNPQVYQARTSAQHMPEPAAAPQANLEIEQLKAQVNSLVAAKEAEKYLPVVEQFSDGKPDFEAVAEAMETILKEGFVEKLFGSGLSHEQRMSEAYRMAGGQYLSSRSEADPLSAHSEATTERPVNPDAGKKSVRGAPADGTDTAVDDPESSEIGELLRKEMKRMRA